MEEICLELNGENVSFVKIPSGKFQMGSINELPYALETPVHEAVIPNAFFVSRFLITQEQYESVIKINPSGFRHAANLPVENVSWIDAKAFCRKATELLGKLVRLPSETEWEYICRAGSTTEYFFGDSDENLSDYAWFELNSADKTHPVGLKKPNDWGIHDIIGNVWEWCEDVWKGDYTNFPSDGSANLQNIEKQPRRSVRGGSYAMNAFRCRSTYRSFDWNDSVSDKLGFRVIIE